MERRDPKSKNPEDGMELLETNTGLKVKPFCSPGDVPKLDYRECSGDPGLFPFTRGSLQLIR